ncbi:MAG: glycosyltransferase family 2 protein [Bacteroidales bacterium]|nr:glycosyltransferase family 2 protein [Bacteroidales bacterium]
MDTLYLVIPCYNEEEVLPETSKRLYEKISVLIEIKQIKNDSKIMFVNDGSKDKTWDIIEELHRTNHVFCGVNLSKNSGHQNALYAGLMEARKYADIVISLDADLQDDIGAIDEFLKEYYSGSEIVYGVRSSRRTDTYYKKTTAHLFNKLMISIGVDLIYNHADYRLMNKRALDCLSNFQEVNLFLRGIVPLIGLRYSIVEYARNERVAGKSKYPLGKMIHLAWDGITSFSIKPIRIVSGFGLVIFVISIIALIYILFSKIFGNTVPGWTSIAVSLWMIGGIQLLSLGIIGEYIGKIYSETKNRPKFIVSDILITKNE